MYPKNKIKIPLLISLLLFVCISYLEAQMPKKNAFAKHTLYAEAANKGAIYSVNYDRIFSYGEKFNKSYRIGFSILNNTIALPIGINFITGKKNDHAAFSLTIVPFIEEYKYLFSPGSLSDEKIYIIPTAGYRYQKPGGGFFFTISAGPGLYLDPSSDNFWRMDKKINAVVSGGIGFSF